MDNISKFEQLNEIINESNNILVVAHVDPDGDAIGSALAMYNYLVDIGKNAQVLLKKVATNFNYLARFENIITDEKDINKDLDLLLVLDCGDQDRVALDFEKCDAKKVISIDHHATHIDFGDMTILDSVAPAACQIVYDYLTYVNANITNEIAECIYTGILTDTGSFRYSNVIPHTFEIAMKLLEKGINIADISRRANDIMSMRKFELLKTALNDIQIIDEKIAYLYLDKSILSNDDEEDENNIHEGLVNYGRDIENVEVSVMIRQEAENLYKVSMRSNDYVDVSQIAQKFGGGGHVKAAGIKYSGDLDELKNNLLEEIKKAL